MKSTNSTYQSIRPKNDLLKKAIKLYYFQTSTNPSSFEKITYYPNFTTTLNIYKNSKVNWSAESRTHEKSSDENFLKILVGKIDKTREIVMKGVFNKLTIVFQPLGINHFFEKQFSELVEEHFSFFDEFGNTFDELLAKVFDERSIEAKGVLLDEYLANRYIGFEEDRLNYAINKIFENKSNISIQQIADELNISRKTLTRLFKKHLSMSFSEYKSIVKFRNALDAYNDKLPKKTLGNLAHETLYYDQSDLNFHFKQKTGLTPQQLFKAIQTIGKELYWKIEDVPKVQDKD